MTQEEKQLLFQDICSRLPYKVKIEVNSCYIDNLIGIDNKTISTRRGINYPINVIKPYLRPMSSMTEEEKKEHDFYCGYKPYDKNSGESYLTEYDMPNYMDWLNEHHFDYRKLIEKGLAIEAPKEMYK